MSRRGRSEPPDVERLPRGRGLRLSTPELLRILFVAALLVAIIAMQGPCSDAVGRFIAGFDSPQATPDAVTAEPPGGYVRLRSDMTEAELRKAVDEARGQAPAAPTLGPDAAAP